MLLFFEHPPLPYAEVAAAAAPGARIHRLHPRAVPETAEADSRRKRLLMAGGPRPPADLDKLVAALTRRAAARCAAASSCWPRASSGIPPR